MMPQSGKFWDKIAERYERQPVADEESYQKKLEITREYLRPDMEVLEIGCGTGSTALSHAPYVKHIQAIDISSKMIEIAQRKARDNNVNNVAFTQSAIDEFSLPDQSLDAVLALNVLHLLDSKEEAISKIHRMLRPSGVFISHTGCLGDNMKFFRLIAPIGKFLGLIPLVRVFTRRDLEGSLIDAGFKLDHQWQQAKGAVFIVAIKAE